MIICKIYNDTLKIPLNEIGRIHDFYELRGDSLNIICISSKIEKELKNKICIKNIMNHPIINDLSKYVEMIIKDDKNNDNEIEIIKRHNSKEFPITSQ